MSEPFLGEIKIMSFNFAPKGWAMCNGQLMAINQNQALFALLGTTYGGNGQTTFALPDLRGRVPMHFGGAFVQGQVGGQETHTLITSEMPAHLHSALGATAAPNNGSPTGHTWAMLSSNAYSTLAPDVALQPASIGNAGGSQPHENRSPFLVLTFCIALQGIFPSRN